ncbi:sigma-70 RNA polymerase sigma factor region 4 domain-containing protein [Flavilitoribacter nigricans]|uniref:Uncharacterized protein n=1 Tax=Flavilitoribacter nigricans (strain ATCC 23147 / DSM 23189 / NBRC 102662 / NCIMB 1420 / SS-2) TaxID=1122177 RepID=A0A2D0N0A1_FLAN2|nr:sigma-70 family RNA polymerase sigma factor [Flavilitoribacter nigricans]PHN01982.1 hypothetical protein CRP01_34315 [Flavilitoribacter nigricans DSM 23189 = NBRC 102662]
MRKIDLTSELLRFHQDAFKKWSHKRWPNHLFDDQLLEDEFTDVVCFYLKHHENGVLDHAEIQWDYIAMMGYYRLRDKYNKKKAHRVIELPENLIDKLTYDEDRKEFAAIARDAFDRLSETEKDLLAARTIHELRYREIVEEKHRLESSNNKGKLNKSLHKDEAKTRQRFTRALDKLRKNFAQILETGIKRKL